MNVTFEHKPEMTLIGFSTSIRMDEGDRKCPEFRDYECGIWVPVCRLPQGRESGTETAPAATPISREH